MPRRSLSAEREREKEIFSLFLPRQRKKLLLESNRDNWKGKAKKLYIKSSILNKADNRRALFKAALGRTSNDVVTTESQRDTPTRKRFCAYARKGSGLVAANTIKEDNGTGFRNE